MRPHALTQAGSCSGLGLSVGAGEGNRTPTVSLGTASVGCRLGHCLRNRSARCGLAWPRCARGWGPWRARRRSASTPHSYTSTGGKRPATSRRSLARTNCFRRPRNAVCAAVHQWSLNPDHREGMALGLNTADCPSGMRTTLNIDYVHRVTGVDQQRLHDPSLARHTSTVKLRREQSTGRLARCLPMPVLCLLPDGTRRWR